MTVSFLTEPSKKYLSDKNSICYWPIFQKVNVFGQNSYFGHMSRSKIDLYSIIENTFILFIFGMSSFIGFLRSNRPPKPNASSQGLTLWWISNAQTLLSIRRQLKTCGSPHAKRLLVMCLLWRYNIDGSSDRKPIEP